MNDFFKITQISYMKSLIRSPKHLRRHYPLKIRPDFDLGNLLLSENMHFLVNFGYLQISFAVKSSGVDQVLTKILQTTSPPPKKGLFFVCGGGGVWIFRGQGFLRIFALIDKTWSKFPFSVILEPLKKVVFMI